MTCEEMKTEIIGLIYEEIDEQVRLCVESHLAGCGACRRERDRLEETSALLRGSLAGEEEIPARPLSRVWNDPHVVSPAGGPRWSRFVMAACLLPAASLVVLAAGNTRLQKDASGWSLQFSLLPRRETARAETVDEVSKLAEEHLRAELSQRFERERSILLDAVDRRLEESRETLVRDLSHALARQEETLSAGFRSDKEELLRRGREVEQIVGTEIGRTREMIGAVLAASGPKVTEQ